jgi:hypothetical protein
MEWDRYLMSASRIQLCFKRLPHEVMEGVVPLGKQYKE